jgi:hypothetical protein
MSEINFTTDKIKVCEFVNTNGLWDIVTVDGFLVASDVMSARANQIVHRVNEHDALVDEVEAYKEKEKICTSCEQHPSWEIRAEKAEAEVVRLSAKERIVNVIKGEENCDDDGYFSCNLYCPICGEEVGGMYDEDDDGVLKYNLIGKYCCGCGQRIDYKDGEGCE